MAITLWIFLLALSCCILHSLVGSLIIPLQGSLVIDALGHSVLLGIVTTFFIVQNLSSPWLFVGAIASGLLMHAIERLIKVYGRVSQDVAVGVSFSFCFSLAIILVTIYAQSIHLDLDMILLGSIEFSLYDQISLGILTGPKAFWINLISIIFVICFIARFYRQLKLLLFDKQSAYMMGVRTQILELMIIALASTIIVFSLQVAGAIVLVGFAAAPFVSYWFYEKSWLAFLIKSVFFSAIMTISGVSLALIFDLSISGSLAVCFCIAAIIKQVYKHIV